MAAVGPRYFKAAIRPALLAALPEPAVAFSCACVYRYLSSGLLRCRLRLALGYDVL